jgi:hypothetical protein
MSEKCQNGSDVATALASLAGFFLIGRVADHQRNALVGIGFVGAK